MKISMFWPWRWLFWKRVRCSAHLADRSCLSPALIKCVRPGWGEDFARDPLCCAHGSVGPCPDGYEQAHVLIPPDQLWRRIRWRLRLVCEGDD